MIGTAAPIGNLCRILRTAASWRWVAAAALTVSLSGCKDVFFAAINSAESPRNIAIHRNLEFDARTGLDLDVYAPASAAGAPVVVFIYGGSWESGKRRWYGYVGKTLASNGIVTMIPDYRKYPDVQFPVFVDDAANAVRWARDHATEFGGDPSRLYVMGHSAGGQIAALLACDPRYLDAAGMRTSDLSGMIGLAGAYDFLPFVEEEPQIFGADETSVHDSQPINFVNASEPALLLLQGEDDDEVEPSNAKSMAAKARAAGSSVELKLYPGVGHASIILSLARAHRTKSRTLDDILAFIHEPHGAAANSAAGSASQ
ncbi:MAG TPA: alpha/beta hydrolase [Rudaea sp.]|nr:alpha/beta hydrolase [Rudaea sp.]